MIKPSKRLSLSSETLRTLSGSQLDNVVGGMAMPNTTKTGEQLTNSSKITRPPQSGFRPCTEPLTTGVSFGTKEGK